MRQHNIACEQFDSNRPRFQSLPVRIPGRYLAGQDEHPCETTAMSLGEIELCSETQEKIGQRVIIYLADLGRFVGIVDHHTFDGFAVSIDLPSFKADSVADKLTWFANRKLLRNAEKRRHERIVPLNRRILLSSPGIDEEHLATIKDVSASGVALETSQFRAIGQEVVVGSTPARVVRHFNGGFACEFLEPLEERYVDETIRL